MHLSDLGDNEIAYDEVEGLAEASIGLFCPITEGCGYRCTRKPGSPTGCSQENGSARLVCQSAGQAVCR